MRVIAGPLHLAPVPMATDTYATAARTPDGTLIMAYLVEPPDLAFGSKIAGLGGLLAESSSMLLVPTLTAVSDALLVDKWSSSSG
jgi:hypothetical protein